MIDEFEIRDMTDFRIFQRARERETPRNRRIKIPAVKFEVANKLDRMRVRQITEVTKLKDPTFFFSVCSTMCLNPICIYHTQHLCLCIVWLMVMMDICYLNIIALNTHDVCLMSATNNN